MKKNKVTVIQAFKEFIWPRKGIVLVGLILIVVSRLASLVLPLKSKELLDEIIPNQDMDGLINMVLIVAGAILVQAVTSFALTRLLSVEAQLLISKLRAKVQKKVLSFPISYFDNNKSVPTPPGSTINPCAYFTNITFLQRNSQNLKFYHYQ